MSSSTTSQVRVLVIENEQDVQTALVRYLTLEGLLAQGVGTLIDADTLIRQQAFDILLLDLGLPDGDGIEWLKKRNDLHNKGVIIVTARADGMSRVSGVKAGADVYLVKPVLTEEIVLLIHNLMRRLRGQAAPAWRLNELSWQLASPDGLQLKLTHSERILLKRFSRSPGQTVSREELTISLGFNPDHYDFRRLETLIRRLRIKAENQFKVPLPLETAHGLGYAFTAEIQLD
jgi:two-component system OmpR family response regulator